MVIEVESKEVQLAAVITAQCYFAVYISKFIRQPRAEWFAQPAVQRF